MSRLAVVHVDTEREFETPWGKIWKRGADVSSTFRKVTINEKTGEKWRPPTEYRNDYLFKVNRENP
jgi:hypothetical protein